MGILFSSTKQISHNSRKRKLESLPEGDGSSPIQKRIRSTYEYVYRELFCKGEGSDIVISALGYEWLLHRIYIKQSPFFSAMLDGGWKESNCSKLELELSDENITKHSLDVIFGSFYYDCVSLTDQTVLNILAAATWFHLDDIRQSCSDFLKRRIRLDTVIEFHAIAGKYSLPELNNSSIHWLSQKLLVLQDSPELFFLLKNTPISLMQSVVSHPKLVVVQLEQDIFICLLKWLYLQHHPDKVYCPASQLHKEAYTYFSTIKPDYLESSEGEPYASVFRGVRWEHVVTIYKHTRRMIQDRIVPKAWLSHAFQRQWLQMMHTHETLCSAPRSSGPLPGAARSTYSLATSNSEAAVPQTNDRDERSEVLLPGPRDNLPDDVFWKLSERFGRRMSNGDSTCSWRWTGFHFGMDVLIKYRRKAFHVIRLTDVETSEGAVSRSSEHRLKICMTVLSVDTTASPSNELSISLDNSLDSISSKSDFPTAGMCTSGVKSFQMTENSVYELLRLPEGFTFPVVVSANILRYDPIDLPEPTTIPPPLSPSDLILSSTFSPQACITPTNTISLSPSSALG